MRHIFLGLIFQPVIRNPLAHSLIHKAVATTPSITLAYPSCARKYCSTALKDQDGIMAHINGEGKSSLDHMAESPSIEADLVNGLKLGGVEQHAEEKQEPKLPPLSAADWKAYNSMAEHMEYFHRHFRTTWNTIYNACVNGRRPSNLSLSQFLNLGLQFVSHLEVHHSIEEMHIFPVLAKKMPEFKQGKNAAELLRQHKEIHNGMDVFQAYLQDCKAGREDFELSTLKAKMDTWGTVLWTHLDQEVATLGANNMRKYWSLEEMGRMPM